MTTISRENYKKELEFYAEKLAYSSFANKSFAPLKERGLDVSNIKNFNVVLFFSQFLNKVGEEPTVRLTVRYTLTLEAKGRSTTEATFTKQSGFYEDAIIKHVYKPEFSEYQHFNFTFGKPNAIQLFDAEFVLEEKLGIEDND